MWRHRRRRSGRIAQGGLGPELWVSAAVGRAAVASDAVVMSKVRWACSCPRAMSTAAAKQRSAAWESVSVERKAHSGNWYGKSLERRWETLQARGSESTWSPQHCPRCAAKASQDPLRKGGMARERESASGRWRKGKGSVGPTLKGRQSDVSRVGSGGDGSRPVCVVGRRGTPVGVMMSSAVGRGVGVQVRTDE